MSAEQSPTWDHGTRMPVPPPPSKSCDCQFHIAGDIQKYPRVSNPSYEPQPDTTFADAQCMLAKLGFSRGVIVQPRPYGTDHSLIIDTLDDLGPEGRRNFRATAIINDEVKDCTIARMDELGICGARFNLGLQYKDAKSLGSVKRSIDRAREIGWHIKLHISGEDVMDLAEFLDTIKNVTVVVDHMAHPHFAGGLDQAPLRWIIDKLKSDENWWVLCSNGNRYSKLESGYDDAVPFGKAIVAGAPDRVVWGSDWPHVNWHKARMMNDAEAVELFYRYVDNDPALIQKILVDNPTRLFGFSD